MTMHHTRGMARTKIAITLDEVLLRNLDDLVRQAEFENRSRAIEAAVREKLERLRNVRLARECARLDADEERELAEEGMAGDGAEWPEY